MGTALEQLLFRPVQRMCVYPLLFKQALNQGRGKEGRGVSEEGLQAFAACFDMVSRTIEEVNENVREQEAEARMRSVLVDQVRAAHAYSCTCVGPA